MATSSCSPYLLALISHAFDTSFRSRSAICYPGYKIVVNNQDRANCSNHTDLESGTSGPNVPFLDIRTAFFKVLAVEPPDPIRGRKGLPSDV